MMIPVRRLLLIPCLVNLVAAISFVAMVRSEMSAGDIMLMLMAGLLAFNSAVCGMWGSR